MLKPLFGRTLSIQTTYESSQKAQYASGARPSTAITGHSFDDARDDAALTDYSNSGTANFHSTFVKGGGSDDDSETFIFADIPQDAVVKKTEISVVNSKR